MISISSFQLIKNSLRLQSLSRSRSSSTTLAQHAFTTSATQNNNNHQSIDPSNSSTTPNHLINHPHPPLHPPQSLSDIQIGSFYNALMSHPQSISPRPPVKPTSPLTQADLEPLLKFKTSAELPRETRKQIIVKLSHLSSQSNHVLPLSITTLNKNQPWLALLQSAASDEDEEDLLNIFKLAQDFHHDQALLLGQVLLTIKSSRESLVTKRINSLLLNAAEKTGLSSSSVTHQLEVYRLLNSTAQEPVTAFQAADKYVRKLEKAGKPASPEVYLQLFDFINYVSMKRITSIDLFNRVRLLAHPNPPISIWNALLRALASGASTSPERAMDAFLDLKANGLTPTVETYNHLIRSMIRARRSATGTSDRKRGYEKWYSSALRLLKQMIDDDGLRPNLTTFLVLLEGSKRVGDLARAKWTYGLFLQQLQIERSNPLVDHQELDWIHASAGISLFQTYASFKPINKYLQVKKKSADELQILPKSSFKDPEFFKNLPQTTHEILNEAELLLAQFIDPVFPNQSHLQTRNKSDQRQLSILISSYLSVYSSHSTIDELFLKFNTYTHPIKSVQSNNRRQQHTGSIRISWTYCILLERCEFLRSAEKAGMIGRQIFHEWIENSPLLKEFELVQSVESRLTSQIWAAWIRLQAKYGSPEESMKELEHFYKTYPPPRPIPRSRIESNPMELEESNNNSILQEITIPKSSSTSSKSIDDNKSCNNNLDLPYLTFQHVEILHHKLKLIEDSESIKRLTTIVKKYENSRRNWHEVNAFDRLNRIQKGYIQ